MGASRKWLWLLGFTLNTGVVVGEEVMPGTVLEASNWDILKDKTFENHRIGDMVPAGMLELVLKHGLKLPLRHSENVQIDPRFVELSNKYAHKVVYDRTTQNISGYVAGMPFPDVQRDAIAVPDRAEAGRKLIWNNVYGNPTAGDNTILKKSRLFTINGETGIEREQIVYLTKIRMSGRLAEPHVLGDGSVNKQQMLFVLAPYDVKGVGQYIVRYNDGRPDDTYAYIKSVRRVRRVSGNTWMDSLAGSVAANEDLDLLDAHPLWYESYNLLGETTTLAVAHSPAGPIDLDNFIDHKNPPYWNPIGMQWEPRQTYVIEGKPPVAHLYGKKTLWMEKDYPTFYWMEVHDRKNRLWKVGMNFFHPSTVDESPTPAVAPRGGVFIDLQSLRGTVSAADGFRLNVPGVSEEQFSVREMQKLVQ
jgi:hypothetical protein